ncbi:hypothetical protein AB0J83_47425 [Actinoplanes sp. NPDC049596]|uniref:hypothetical protein n=1 Tax=unclassified Actinoplanes TaxID=2626549 RepID=UPI003425CD17
MPEQSSPVTTSTAWPHLLPPGTIAEWKRVDPNAPAVLLQQITEDARHMRRMAWARLISAVTLFAGSLGVSALFVHTGAAAGGAVSAGAGTITVVTILC